MYPTPWSASDGVLQDSHGRPGPPPRVVRAFPERIKVSAQQSTKETPMTTPTSDTRTARTDHGTDDAHPGAR